MKDNEELTKEEILARAEAPFKVSKEFLEFMKDKSFSVLHTEFPNMVEDEG